MAEKKTRGGLGRGYFDIFDDNETSNKDAAAEMVRISNIEPRKDQPRKTFDKEALELLADSIGKYGVLQPIIIRENVANPGTYEIIAGERRWRAAKLAGKTEIPAVIIDGDELKAAQVSIIENVQREDLNPVEEAMAYETLIERFGLKQDEVAAQVGKSRSAIANMLRLLDLPDEVLEMLRDGQISTGHARTLLGLDNEEQMLPLANKIVANNMSVREVETAVKKLNSIAQAEAEAEIAAPSPYKMMAKSYMKDLERRSMQALGRKVRILQTARKKVVELSFDSNDDLEVLLTAICGQEIFSEN
ncbi:MAG: ParB/RepB/Spo0J family partition protein [Ruminococcaceae bacterium]|nr:ParB/RepB/Spo0J family partition protein [Oscillospiraceae bacterium]